MALNLKISVVVPTCNRPKMLDKLLESIFANDYTPFELIIVDQSLDFETQKIVEIKYGEHPQIQYIRSPIMCSSDSRNRGWMSASGEYIVFVDDDEIVSNGWLAAYATAFEKLDLHYGIVGGRVLPLFEGKKPDWVPQELSYLLTTLDAGDETCDFPQGWLPGGGNMGVPKKLLQEVSGFDVRVGLKHGGNLPYLGGEDSLLALSIQKLGYKFLYLPEALVFHPVPKERLTRRFFLSRNYREGVTNLHLNYLLNRFSPSDLKHNIFREFKIVVDHIWSLFRAYKFTKYTFDKRVMFELSLITRGIGNIRHSFYLLNRR